MVDIQKLDDVYLFRRDDESVCIYQAHGKFRNVLHDSLKVRDMMDRNGNLVLSLRGQLATQTARVATLEAELAQARADDDVEDEPEVKLCPFRFSVGENIGYECIGEQCALFVGNQCAVAVLATRQNGRGA